MTRMGGGAGALGTSLSRKAGPGGFIQTSSYDAGAAMQQRMAVASKRCLRL